MDVRIDKVTTEIKDEPDAAQERRVAATPPVPSGAELELAARRREARSARLRERLETY